MSLWKRYVDDIIEKIKKNTISPLTDHLNQIDTTGNVKFTCEAEKDGQIPFLDVNIIRKPDGSIKLRIYRKATHTDQYLMFDSHHPVEHKLSVIRTLLGRNNEIVTEEADKLDEYRHVKAVLKTCKYPTWAIHKVEKQLAENKEAAQKEKKKPNEKKKRGMVVLPYVQGVTERVQRTMRKHGVEAPARPHTTLRQLLVHPKDKIPDDEKCGVVYCVSCLNCSQKYVGETGRKLGTRITEHRKEADKVTSSKKTRSTSVTEDTTSFKSAISEHSREKKSYNGLEQHQNIRPRE